MSRRAFLDDQKQAELEEFGYTVVQILTPEQAAEALEEIQAMTPDDGFEPDGSGTFPATYHCTFLDANHEYRRQVDDLNRRLFVEPVGQLLDRYWMLTSNIYAKSPGAGRFEIHQNWPVTDDIRDTTLTLWCPFTAVDAEMGTLCVVPGSHKIVPDLFTVGATKYFNDFYDQLIDEWLVPIELQAGECVLFDDSLLHWSEANTSSKHRWASQLVFMPEEKTPVVYYFDGTDGQHRFTMYEVSPDFFIDKEMSDLLAPTADLPFVGTVERVNQPLTLGQFTQLMANGPAIRRQVYAGLPIGEAYRSPSPTGAGVGRDALRFRRRRQPAPSPVTGIRDTAVARRLERDGYAVIGPTLSADECLSLRATFDEAVERLNQPIGATWFPTILLPDPEVRRFIDDEVRAVVLPHLAEVFDLDEIEPVRIDYSVKPPSPESELGPHQDFSIVDEDRWTSYYAWIPLIDTDEANGTLHVLPGSHHFTNTIRSRHVPAMFDPVLDEVRDRSIRLDCRAGDLVIMTSGVVHFSPPNLTGDLRLAAHGIFKPRAAPLLFYYADDETPADEVEVYEVSIDDYIELALTGRPGPEVPVRDRRPRQPVFMDADRLAAGLSAYEASR